MAPNPELITFASRDAMAARVADLVETVLACGAECDGRGEFAVSGGSTPGALYELLAARSLDWNNMRVTLVDERWVGPDHPRSNESFVREAFGNTDAEIIALYNDAPSPKDAVDDISARLHERKKPFDIVILGMGDDGHTASWFPHAEGLSTALESVELACAIKAKKSAVTGDEIERMTLTLSAIQDAKLIILMITGAEKRTVFERACDDGRVEDMPVRAILRARTDMWVCWAP